jgi:hypothetical protein
MPTTEKLIDPKILKETEKKESNKRTEEIVILLLNIFNKKKS